MLFFTQLRVCEFFGLNRSVKPGTYFVNGACTKVTAFETASVELRAPQLASVKVELVAAFVGATEGTDVLAEKGMEIVGCWVDGTNWITVVTRPLGVSGVSEMAN